jgi:hypothetical protein
MSTDAARHAPDDNVAAFVGARTDGAKLPEASRRTGSQAPVLPPRSPALPPAPALASLSPQPEAVKSKSAKTRADGSVLVIAEAVAGPPMFRGHRERGFERIRVATEGQILARPHRASPPVTDSPGVGHGTSAGLSIPGRAATKGRFVCALWPG